MVGSNEHHPLALLQTCRAELLAARRSVADCFEALERSIEKYAALHAAGIGSYQVGQLHDEETASTSILLGEGEPIVQVGLAFDAADTERPLRLAGLPIPLTDTELAIFAILWRRKPQPVSREELIQALYKHPVNPKTVDPFISHIRQKLRLASGGTEYIEAVRRRGWRLRVAKRVP